MKDCFTVKILMLLLTAVTFIFAQDDEVADEVMLQPRRLVDSHTAGILPRAWYDLETRVYPGGSDEYPGAGMAFSFSVGITERLNLGGGYGADGIIGRGSVKPNPYPSLFIKYRIFEETFIRPAMALGFDPTGFGGIENDTLNYKGYVYKSQGFFAAFSKNYLLFKKMHMGLHGTLNFSIEDVSDVKWPNLCIGSDLGFNEELAVAVEYDFAFNQKDRTTEGYANPLNGMLNAGLRWNIVPSLYFELTAKDITGMKLYDKNGSRGIGWSREIKLVYAAGFLNQ